MPESKEVSKINQNQWAFIFKDSWFENEEDGKDSCQAAFHTLKNPKSGEVCQYLFPGNGMVCEVLVFDEGHRSFFIGETVQQDGRLHLPTPVDPLYLVLPYLRRADTRYVPLDQVVVDDEVSGCVKLCDCVEARGTLTNIAMVKGSDDFTAYKYCEKKTLKWLKKKVDKVAASLKSNSIPVSGGAAAAVYVASSKSLDVPQEEYVRYAHGVVSDYLPPDLAGRLRDHMGIPAEVRSKPELDLPPAKKAKHDSLTPTEDYSQGDGKAGKPAAGKVSSAHAKLAKVDKSGMKSMMSFFSKPKK